MAYFDDDFLESYTSTEVNGTVANCESGIFSRGVGELDDELFGPFGSAATDCPQAVEVVYKQSTVEVPASEVIRKVGLGTEFVQIQIYKDGVSVCELDCDTCNITFKIKTKLKSI